MVNHPILVSSLTSDVVDVFVHSRKTGCILRSQEVFMWGFCNKLPVWRPQLFDAKSASTLLSIDSETVIDNDVPPCFPESIFWNQIVITKANLFLIGSWSTFSQVFACGDNAGGQLGHPHGNSLVNPTLVPGLLEQFILKVSVASTHVMALNSRGQLMGWGSKAPLLPNPTDLTSDDDHPQLIQFPDPFPVLDISSASRHHLVLTGSGRVFGWGQGLPIPADGEIHRLVGVPEYEGFSHISTSANHSAVASEDGTVWVFGCNSHGQLGVSTVRAAGRSNSSSNVSSAVELSTIAPLQLLDLSVGKHSTIVLVEDDPIDLLFRASIRRFGKNSFEGSKLRSVLFHPCGQFFQQQLKAYYDVIELGLENNLYRSSLRSTRSTLPFGSSAERSARSKAPCYLQKILFSRYDLEFGLYGPSKQGFRVQSVPLPVYMYVSDTLTISNLSEENASFVIQTLGSEFFAGMDTPYHLNVNPPFFTLPPGTQLDVQLSLIMYLPTKLVEILPVEIKVGLKVYRIFLKVDLTSSPLAMVPEVPYAEISQGEIIGSGATGSVLKVQWRGLCVAVKHYTQLSATRDFKEFRREVMIAGNL
ncbi:MAG: hypothetical protein Q8P67_12815, partial [archaeon]|nr:hypothetical protein [archaeon]